jgi:hypothetical protein
MLEITLRYCNDGWYWKSNNTGCGGAPCQTSDEAVAAAIAAEAATQDAQAAHGRAEAEKAATRAAELRKLR